MVELVGTGTPPFMNELVKPLGGPKWAEKGNWEMPEMEFTKFMVWSRAKAVTPSPNAL